MEILLTLVVIAVLIFLIMKKLDAVMALFSVGLITLIIYGIVTGNSPAATSSGNVVIDAFEVVKAQFSSAFSGIGQTIIPIVAFSHYMNEIGATRLLVLKAIKPFKNVKNPYILCIFACALGAVLKMILPSQVGLMALLMVTAYPIMVGLGMSKIAAGASCLLGTAFDWGPACPTTTQVVTAAVGYEGDAATLFFSSQIKTFPIAILVAGIIAMVVNKSMDKKMGYVLGTDNVGKAEEEPDLPGFYALIPIIPLILVILFSGSVIPGVKITPFASVIVTFVLVVIVEGLRKKSFVTAFVGTKAFWGGMGRAFGDFIPLIACSGIFTAALNATGGIAKIPELLGNLTLPGILIILVVCVLAVLMTVVSGTSTSTAPLFSQIATSFAPSVGLSLEQAMLPTLLVCAYGRSLSPISGIMLFMSRFMDVDVMVLIKRNALPMVGGFVTMLITSLLFC